MRYNQNVIIKNYDFNKVKESFHNIEIVKFLTRFQPVKIIHWSGITNGEKAHFKLWLLGWKNFKVEHKEYKSDKDQLFFIDKGIELPLGITCWEHKHIVKKMNKNTLIQDKVYFNHSNKYIGYLLFPVLMFPIIIRKLFYRLYFINKP